MEMIVERLFKHLFDSLFFEAIRNDVYRKYRLGDSAGHFTLESRTFLERCNAEEKMALLIGVDHPLDMADQSASVLLETTGEFGEQ